MGRCNYGARSLFRKNRFHDAPLAKTSFDPDLLFEGGNLMSHPIASDARFVVSRFR